MWKLCGNSQPSLSQFIVCIYFMDVRVSGNTFNESNLHLKR